MALFKIQKGRAANLAANRPYANEGFAYFTIDEGKFYIDIAGDGTSSTPAVTSGTGRNRICLNAATADNVKNSLIITFNSGTTEGATKFTFNGSAQKEVNITPSMIGAIAEGATVQKAQMLVGSNNNGLGVGGQYKPVYFSNGVPVAITYELHALVNGATKQGIAYYSATDNITSTSAGSAGQLLQSGGGGTTAPSWITATPAEQANTIVKRDGSGDFSAHQITADLIGNASTASKLNNRFIIKFDDGATEGENLYTFDGSAAKNLKFYSGDGISVSWDSQLSGIKVENTGVTSIQINGGTAQTKNVSIRTSAVVIRRWTA